MRSVMGEISLLAGTVAMTQASIGAGILVKVRRDRAQALNALPVDGRDQLTTLTPLMPSIEPAPRDTFAAARFRAGRHRFCDGLNICTRHG